MPPNTHSKVTFAKIKLPYPVFSADFDPYNRGYLVVGGGGGPNKSGVPNQISVLDVSSRASIENVLDVELSRDEDSAVSLANLATKDGLVVFAGVNSSEKDQNNGRNEHLRSFEIKYPPRKKQKVDSSDQNGKGTYKLLGKRSLFVPATGPRKETYQRLLKLSPAQQRDTGSKRIGAIASGSAKDSEIVVFNATNPTPENADIISKISVQKGEANDLDIAEPETSEFSLAYCTDHDLHEQTFKYDFGRKKTERRPNGPRTVWHVPTPEASATSRPRSRIRCLRFLNSQNVLLLCNRPGQGGAELRIIHLYPTGPGMEMMQFELPKHVKQAASMDVCALDADKEGNQQFVIAIAAQDISIEVYTTNYREHTDTFSPLQKYITLKDVHEQPITKLCFTPFHSTGSAPAGGKTDTPWKVLGTQYISLASTSFCNTVAVDTFPVTPLNPQEKNSRFVLSTDGAWVKWAYILIISLIVLVFAFLIQAFRGGFSNDDTVGLFSLLPRDARDFLDQPARMAYQRGRALTTVTPEQESTPTSIPKRSRLHNLVRSHLASSSEQTDDAPVDKSHAVVVRAEPASSDSLDSDLHISTHPDKAEYLEKDPHAKHWHELQEHERARWRELLIRAEEWTEAEGEKVLMSVLFSEYANIVGEIANEAIREL